MIVHYRLQMEHSPISINNLLPPDHVATRAQEAGQLANREQAYQDLANLRVSKGGAFGTRLSDLVGPEFVKLFLEKPKLAGAWRELSSEFLPHKLEAKHIIIGEGDKISSWEANFFGPLAAVRVTFNPSNSLSLFLKHREDDTSTLLWKIEQAVKDPAYQSSSKAIEANIYRGTENFRSLVVALKPDEEGAKTLCSLFRSISSATRPSCMTATLKWDQMLYPLELGNHTMTLRVSQ